MQTKKITEKRELVKDGAYPFPVLTPDAKNEHEFLCVNNNENPTACTVLVQGRDEVMLGMGMKIFRLIPDQEETNNE